MLKFILVSCTSCGDPTLQRCERMGASFINHGMTGTHKIDLEGRSLLRGQAFLQQASQYRCLRHSHLPSPISMPTGPQHTHLSSVKITRPLVKSTSLIKRIKVKKAKEGGGGTRKTASTTRKNNHPRETKRPPTATMQKKTKRRKPFFKKRGGMLS